MDHIEILPIEEKYYEAVVKLSEKNLKEKLSENILCDLLRYHYNFFYVAYDKNCNRIIGFAGLMMVADEAELLYIATDLPYRKQGIGQMLLSKVVFDVTQKGGKRLLLEVRESNVDALSLYKKNGFTILSTRKNYYHAPVEDAIILEKIIEL